MRLTTPTLCTPRTLGICLLVMSAWTMPTQAKSLFPGLLMGVGGYLTFFTAAPRQ